MSHRRAGQKNGDRPFPDTQDSPKTTRQVFTQAQARLTIPTKDRGILGAVRPNVRNTAGQGGVWGGRDSGGEVVRLQHLLSEINTDQRPGPASHPEVEALDAYSQAVIKAVETVGAAVVSVGMARRAPGAGRRPGGPGGGGAGGGGT